MKRKRIRRRRATGAQTEVQTRSFETLEFDSKPQEQALSSINQSSTSKNRHKSRSSRSNIYSGDSGYSSYSNSSSAGSASSTRDGSKTQEVPG
jgi:hypothetical protein